MSASVGTEQRTSRRATRLFLRLLAELGAATRRHTRFVLLLGALTLGVLRDALHPLSWRRTVRAEFRRTLRQSIGGGFSTVVVTAAMIGIALVSQALFWLGLAGQENLIGSLLVSGIVRGIGPVLVGMILLGRSGMVALAEIASLRTGRQVQAMEAQGLDPFLMLVFPRALALALACFTLTVTFMTVALISGFMADNLLRASTVTFWFYFANVLKAMSVADFIVFPVKTLGIGLLVALCACLVAFQSAPGEPAAALLPRGFMRTVMMILVVNAVLTLVV
jgi:phospholipid/cholesterol/gamma-HCH transport system permease protein